MTWLRQHYRLARDVVRRMRTRGHPLSLSILLYLPRVLVMRAYRIVARGLNRAVFRRVNQRRLRAARHAAADGGAGGCFYMIVMPGTLHFLLPSLALLPRDFRIVLVGNGASRWEKGVVTRRFPHLPYCPLLTLPATSLMHGDVITLLLNVNAENFGLIDHDCFVFDRRILESLAPGPADCLTALYGGVSATTGIAYPETYLLFLHTAVLRELMARYHVDARIYRQAPRALRAVVARIGLVEGVFIKDYAKFFDTLHLLLALGMSEGRSVRFLQRFDSDAVAHLGGTSWKTSETKELIDCYVDWRFLDLAGDDELRRRYGHRTRPFESAAQVRAAIPMTPEAFARVAWIDALVEKLAGTLGSAADAAPG
jgi:hypothetical protein